MKKCFLKSYMKWKYLIAKQRWFVFEWISAECYRSTENGFEQMENSANDIALDKYDLNSPESPSNLNFNLRIKYSWILWTHFWAAEMTSKFFVARRLIINLYANYWIFELIIEINKKIFKWTKKPGKKHSHATAMNAKCDHKYVNRGISMFCVFSLFDFWIFVAISKWWNIQNANNRMDNRDKIWIINSCQKRKHIQFIVVIRTVI